ncbi:Lipoprotein-releasing system transmembrane protein LolE [Pandoraea apista]|nr:Lipoprotein-releasing system transmembrane protein LolE [Pandoraea apista]
MGLGRLVSVNIGTIVPFIERLLGIHFLPQDIYFISELPSDLQSSDVIRIGVISFILSALATIYPSWRASRVKPAEALRYE